MYFNHIFVNDEILQTAGYTRTHEHYQASNVEPYEKTKAPYSFENITFVYRNPDRILRIEIANSHDEGICVKTSARLGNDPDVSVPCPLSETETLALLQIMDSYTKYNKSKK